MGAAAMELLEVCSEDGGELREWVFGRLSLWDDRGDDGLRLLPNDQAALDAIYELHPWQEVVEHTEPSKDLNTKVAPEQACKDAILSAWSYV